MKKHSFLLLSLVLLAAGCHPIEDRSNKNNPDPIDIPGKAFTVTVCDQQPGIEEDSTYYFYGTLTANSDNGIVNFTEGASKKSDYRFTYSPDPVKLILTGFNHISFETSEDVNVESSDKCIDIVKIDARHFELKCFRTPESSISIDEGTARIRFWNGSGSSEKSIYINVDARSSVKCEGFELRINGDKFLLTEIPFEDFKYVKFGDWDKWPQYQYKTQLMFAGKEHGKSKQDIIEDIEQKYNTSHGYCLEFVGTIPRNATPDNRVRRLVDVVSMRTSDIVSYDYISPFYFWNEAGKYNVYRWFPFDDSSRDKVLGKNASTQFYPADLRYRRAWIWNRTDYNDQSSSSPRYQFFCFLFYEGDRERDFIGCIKEK